MHLTLEILGASPRGSLSCSTVLRYSFVWTLILKSCLYRVGFVRSPGNSWLGKWVSGKWLAVEVKGIKWALNFKFILTESESEEKHKFPFATWWVGSLQLVVFFSWVWPGLICVELISIPNSTLRKKQALNWCCSGRRDRVLNRAGSDWCVLVLAPYRVGTFSTFGFVPTCYTPDNWNDSSKGTSYVVRVKAWTSAGEMWFTLIDLDLCSAMYGLVLMTVALEKQDWGVPEQKEFGL